MYRFEGISEDQFLEYVSEAMDWVNNGETSPTVIRKLVDEYGVDLDTAQFIDKAARKFINDHVVGEDTEGAGWHSHGGIRSLD